MEAPKIVNYEVKRGVIFTGCQPVFVAYFAADECLSSSGGVVSNPIRASRGFKKMHNSEKRRVYAVAAVLPRQTGFVVNGTISGGLIADQAK
jgi:hypothetical protein